MKGLVLSVTVSPEGDELASDHLAGDTVINVTKTDDFDTEDFGSVEIDGEVYDYVGVDETAMTLTLATGLLTDLGYGEKILLHPIVIEKWATVEIQQDDDPISALVPQDLWDRIPEGVREPEEQESVVVDQRDGDLVVLDVIGSEPSIDGGFTTPGTSVLDPETQAILDELAAQVQDNSERISNNEMNLEDTDIVAHQANDKATTADGRISISDYEPAPEDAAGRNEGSVWFTRTRARVNYMSNPSFEASTANLYMDETAVARVVDAGAVDGTYVLEVTNSGTSAPHMVSWLTSQPVLPGQKWTSSLYVKSVSGIAAGWVNQIVWWDSTPAIIGTTTGDAVTLATDAWGRVFVTGEAPSGAAFATFRAVSPLGAEGAVWRMDGWLIENSDLLGRYFDGTSYDGVWSGTPELSSSVLEGGKITRMFELDDGAWVPKQFMGDVLQDINADEIKSGSMDGERIQDNSIPIDKMTGTPGIAGEALTAGNLVCILNEGGLTRVYKADASNKRPAHGYILADVPSGGVAMVYSYGYNPLLSGLTPGLAYLSTTVPGAVQNAAPITTGKISQKVGVAVGSTTLNFLFSTPITIT